MDNLDEEIRKVRGSSVGDLKQEIDRLRAENSGVRRGALCATLGTLASFLDSVAMQALNLGFDDTQMSLHDAAAMVREGLEALHGE